MNMIIETGLQTLLFHGHRNGFIIMRFGWQQANGAVADMSPVSDKLNRGENQVDKMYTEFMLSI